MTKSVEKACLECGDRISGRMDKKFCSDNCRAAYNNKLHSDSNDRYVRNVNNKLRRNRRILQELNVTGKTKVSREKLAERGFDFTLITRIYTTKDGATYYYCYDQGYLPVDTNFYLLVIRKEL